MRKNGKSPSAHRRASTGDVLGLVVLEAPKVPHKWSEHHRKLRELKDRLTSERHSRTESAKDEIPSSGEHMADAATDTYDRDWALAALSSTQSLLYEIETALSRIHNGSYGTCELTGRPIEAERLKAVPWTRFSAEAQARIETKGQDTRFQLGQLGGYIKTIQLEDADDFEDLPASEQREAA